MKKEQEDRELLASQIRQDKEGAAIVEKLKWKLSQPEYSSLHLQIGAIFTATKGLVKIADKYHPCHACEEDAEGSVTYLDKHTCKSNFF